MIFSCVPGQHYIFRIGSYADIGGPGTLNIIYTPADPCTPPPAEVPAPRASVRSSPRPTASTRSGTYFGDGTDCSDPTLCVPPPAGACCVAGQCGVTTQADCLNQGGIDFGDGTIGSCSDPDLCNAPSGMPCCVNGVCSITCL